VARDYDLLFEPFIYQPLIDFQTLLPRAELLLEDGVHPNAAGVRELVAHSMPIVEKAIRKRRGN
jgi:lysophospholipase L1-like esterase